MFPEVVPTAKLTPDPIAICAHINRLTSELRLARRLLRVTEDARLATLSGDQRTPTATPSSTPTR